MGSRPLTHEECERAYRKGVRVTFLDRYLSFMANLQENHPRLYDILRGFGA